MIKIISLLLIGFLTFANCEPKCPEVGNYVACYYAGWSFSRPEPGNFNIYDIDPTLCTHLIYSFAGLNLDGEIDSLDPTTDFQNGGYGRFNKLKEKNPCLKTLLAIGGWGEGSEKYSIMVKNVKSREEFVDRVERYLVHFGFDGLDVDWEYPAQRGGLKEDRENFIILLKLLKERLSLRNRLLTVAVGVAKYLQDYSYDIPQICNNVDLVFFMGYDLQYPDITSYHAPLRKEKSEPADRENLDYTVNYYINKGCSSKKIMFGLPVYGRTYTLKNVQDTSLGAPVNGSGRPGSITRENGFLGYNEICDMIDFGDWKFYDLTENVARVATLGDQWIAYDDQETIKIKTQYAMEKKLAGVMFWSIDTDDFRGYCNQITYPFLRAAAEVLGNDMNFNP